MSFDDPKRLTKARVPAAAEHVFMPLMDVMNDADEIWGVTDPADYIAMMEAVIAEAQARIANAKTLLTEGA